jgi:single-strand DNA-binding protein
MLEIIFTGNLGRDPEMRYTPSGQAVTNFSVAETRKWTGADGQKHSETTWLRCSAWGKTAENCNAYLKKGKKVLVRGRLTPGADGTPKTFQASDGTTKAGYDVTVENIEFLSDAQHAEGEAAPEQTEETIPL